MKMRFSRASDPHHTPWPGLIPGSCIFTTEAVCCTDQLQHQQRQNFIRNTLIKVFLVLGKNTNGVIYFYLLTNDTKKHVIIFLLDFSLYWFHVKWRFNLSEIQLSVTYDPFQQIWILQGFYFYQRHYFR